jgi:hypothetical protein
MQDKRSETFNHVRKRFEQEDVKALQHKDEATAIRNSFYTRNRILHLPSSSSGMKGIM